MTSLPGVFSGFVFIVAMVERATEVIIGIIRPKNQEYRQELKLLESIHGSKTSEEYRKKILNLSAIVPEQGNLA